ncbi:class Ib ribonucleoside-diphosphate reductase assembly flavoprotein NrdI [Nanchangia anserum]|uniref:Protein NrdI n=1 Tax=Nanchangia anserum TaxID=2692125 RepID=A0A8I0G8E6_9ACTO|nr:class Ib ribonucleoside-diphosphate reductase assembly flavoprotein NrdI [Nanchangia anserum]MBD3689805.1 class Ib ribonucleoside-diphosphate reductase assembly flavoprotein NrdI [Nanchangia anserum]QOX82542.1 class Ib ribonucleoside-diphosphate reductase assembly flavoprotein NrdI [Nanchangia anserum]
MQPAPDRSDPYVVYFSSATNNTARFVSKLGFSCDRIPLRSGDPALHVSRPYVLVTPTYGGGKVKGAVPKQVIAFLNDPSNRSYCRGVISSGNTNFGEAYALAGRIIARKLNVPDMYRYELLGTPSDVNNCREGLVKFWQNI